MTTVVRVDRSEFRRAKKKPFELYISDSMKKDLDDVIRKNGYSIRDKSLWIEEALLTASKVEQETIVEVFKGIALETEKIRLRVQLTEDGFGSLEYIHLVLRKHIIYQNSYKTDALKAALLLRLSF